MTDSGSPNPSRKRAGELQLHALTREAGGYKLTRRHFLKAAGAAATTGGVIGGCAGELQRPSGNKLLVTDTQAGTLPEAHADEVHAMAISPDGKLLASGGPMDGTIKLWSLREGKLEATLTGHGRNWVEAVVTSLDGKVLASGSEDGINLWSLPGGKLHTTLTLDRWQVQAMAISPDGKLLAWGDDDGHVFVWHLDGERKTRGHISI